MSHLCEAALVACEDFRLHQRKDGRNYTAEFIKELGVDCDQIIRAGGAQAIVRPKSVDYLASVKDCLDVSVYLHKVRRILLMNHDDCGAYKQEFPEAQDLREKNIDDLRKAKEIIESWYEGVAIELYYGFLEAGNSDQFYIRAI